MTVKKIRLMATKNNLVMERKKAKDRANNGTNTTHLDLKRQLIDAVQQSKSKIVKRLMDARIDTNCVNDLNETPLMLACKLDDEVARRKIVPMLLNRDACVNVQDTGGNTALLNAVKQGDEQLVDILLEKGADVSLANSEGNTALCFAAMSGNAIITKVILREIQKHKLPVDHKNMHGLTPLLLAAQGGHVEVARILVRDGKASVTIRDLDNFMTAEQWIKQTGFHSPQEIAFLSPRSRHRRKKISLLKTFTESAIELNSETSPDIFESQNNETKGGDAIPLLLPQIPSHSRRSQQEMAKSMFELPSCSTPASTFHRQESKFSTEHLPGARTSKYDIYSSTYLDRRKNFVERNKKSKFYAKGSLEPLSEGGKVHPLSFSRMNSVTESKGERENSQGKDFRHTTTFPPLKK